MPIEGDYVYLRGVGYLAVKGIIHPPKRVIAFPKHPERKHIVASITSIDDAYAYLRETMPEAILFDDHSGQVLPQIPIEKITSHLSARGWFIRNTPHDELTRRALELAEEICKNSGVGLDYMGLSGSILLGRQRETSDIDIVFYSRMKAEMIMEALSDLRRRGVLGPVDAKHLHDLAAKRSDSPIPLHEWIRHESRKLLYGVYRGVIYSAKIVLLPSEYWEEYGSARWRELGRTTLIARIMDDSYAIYTPNQYGIEVLRVLQGPEESYNIRRVVSFRSRFAEQARRDEEVRISGRIEYDLKSKSFRVFVGNHRDDYLLLNQDYS